MIFTGLETTSDLYQRQGNVKPSDGISNQNLSDYGLKVFNEVRSEKKVCWVHCSHKGRIDLLPAQPMPSSQGSLL